MWILFEIVLKFIPYIAHLKLNLKFVATETI